MRYIILSIGYGDASDALNVNPYSPSTTYPYGPTSHNLMPFSTTG